jgi:hypothetical protein
MDSKLEVCRRCAADCSQTAAAAPSEFAKQHWLAMTAHWMKMAAAEEAATKQMAAPRGIKVTAHTPAPRDLRVVP